MRLDVPEDYGIDWGRSGYCSIPVNVADTMQIRDGDQRLTGYFDRSLPSKKGRSLAKGAELRVCLTSVCH